MPSLANVFKKQNVSQTVEVVAIPDIKPKEKIVEVLKNTVPVEENLDSSKNIDEPNLESTHETDLIDDVNGEDVISNENSFTPFVPERVEVAEPEVVQVLPTKEELSELFEDEIKEIQARAYENAYNKAYEDALSRKKGELTKIISDVDDCLLKMQNLHKEYLEKYALELKFLAVDVAEKMIMDKIYEDELVLKKLVIQTVDSIKNSSWLEIELSQRLEKLITAVREELANSNLQGRVSVTGKTGADDLVRINSEKGTIVADVSRQAVNLKELFKSAK